MHAQRYLYAIFALAIACFLTGCGQAGPTRAPIQGQVSIAGTPLAKGRIMFTPVAPTTGPVATAIITQGKYELPKNLGPVVGQQRVMVEATPELGFEIDDEQAYAAHVKTNPRPAPNPIPLRFQQQVLLVDIVAEQTNTFDVVVPKY